MGQETRGLRGNQRDLHMLPIGTTKLRVTMRAGLRELDALTETPGFKPLEDYPASAAYLDDRHQKLNSESHGVGSPPM